MSQTKWVNPQNVTVKPSNAWSHAANLLQIIVSNVDETSGDHLVKYIYLTFNQNNVQQCLSCLLFKMK